MKRFYDKQLGQSLISVIDIETMGLDTKKGSPISTVALITFDPSKPDFEIVNWLYLGINSGEFYALKVKEDPETVKWTKALPDKVQDHNFNMANANSDDCDYLCQGQKLSLLQSLKEISDYVYFMNEQATEEQTNHFIFGNSPDFDQGMLDIYYDRLNFDKPWKYYQNLDFRTVASFINQSKTDREKLKIEAKEHLHKLVKDYYHGAEFDFPSMLEIEDPSHISLYDAILEGLQLFKMIKQLGV